MRLRIAVIVIVAIFSAIAVYNVCHEAGGAVDTVVGMARRITYGAPFAVGFCSASLVLRKWMSHPVRQTAPAAAPRPPVPTFGINTDTGPGRFHVCGVDHDTKFATSEIVYADSPDNAKFKVELKGVDVVLVERA